MSSFDQVTEISAALLGCLAAAMSGHPNPVAHTAYRLGTEPVHDINLEGMDLCCEGLAYVLLGDTYPSSDSFPDNDIIRQGDNPCIPPGWAINFRFGIVRCAPDPGDDVAQAAAFTQNLYDMWALNKTWCCFRQFIRGSTDYLGMSLVLERQVQGSTSGGCTERYSRVAVQIPNEDCCPYG